MPSNHLILCYPLLLLSSIFPSIRVFSSKSALRIGWQKYWSLTLVLPMNIQGWFPLGLTGLISLQSKGLSRIFSNTIVQKHQFFTTQLSLWSSSHIHTWLLEKTIALTKQTFVNKVISLLFNMLSKFVMVFPDSSVGKESACNAGDSGSIPGSGRSAGEGIGYPFQYAWTSLVAQLVKNLPAVQETWVWSSHPLEKGKATHSSILAWRIPGLYSPWGHKTVRHDWATFTY